MMAEIKERKSRLLGAGDIDVSFEFFPPKTEKMDEQLWAAISRLAPLAPEFVSVTYGAGGSTRERTHAIVSRIIRETGLRPAAHLTCVDATKEEVNEVARAYWAEGVRHIVALRGDPAAGVGSRYQPHPGGYINAADLVSGLKKIAGFEVSVAGYPEKHPESITLAADMENLKAKVDAGADRIITQFGFDNTHFLRFLGDARAAGIWIPIIPGLVPIHNFRQVAGFAVRAGATVPAWLARRFEGIEDDVQTTHLVAAAVATEQAMQLVDEGIRSFHFYTLNRADLVYAICHLLGLRPLRCAFGKKAGGRRVRGVPILTNWIPALARGSAGMTGLKHFTRFAAGFPQGESQSATKAEGRAAEPDGTGRRRAQGAWRRPSMQDWSLQRSERFNGPEGSEFEVGT